MAKRGKAENDKPPLGPNDQIVVDELARQLQERRERPAALLDARRFDIESAARQIAYVQIPAHEQVKIALLMAERLRFLALRADALLAFHGDPLKERDRALELALAPYFRELKILCAPYERTDEGKRDRLIELLSSAADTFERTPREEREWAHVLWALRFQLMAGLPSVSARLTDDDLVRGIAACLPERLRPELDEPLSKWNQLALLAKKAGLGTVDVDTVRVQFTRHRSAKRKQAKAESEELSETPVGDGKLDRVKGLDPATRQRLEKQIRAIELRALAKIRGPKKP